MKKLVAPFSYAVSLALFAFSTASFADRTPENTPLKLRLMETTDIHMNHNGDLLQGSPMGDYMARTGLKDGQVHPAYKAMKPLGYVVGNIGSHEF